VYPTVRDSSGHLVTNLSQNDFAIFDDNHPAKLTVFSHVVQPLAVVVMLDMGAASRLLRLREAATAFLDELGPNDRAAVGTIADEVGLSRSLTSDRSTLKRTIQRETWPSTGGPWTVWPGIDRALSALDNQSSRKVVLLLSSGTDGGGCFVALRQACRSLDQVRARAQRHDAMLYVVIFEGSPADVTWKLCSAGHCPGTLRVAPDPPGVALNAMSEETGGGHFRLADADSAADLMKSVADEIRQQYVLGFSPRVLDDRLHTIRIQVRPPNLVVRARRSYLATRAR
jgi:Ca-activated chloride channel family protein